jgi:hypothetical protein
MNSKNKNIRDLYRGINYFKRGYQPRSNLVKNENGDLLADSHNILNRWKNYRVIRLRCHKKKWKRCRKESPLLPVNSTYMCRRDTTFVSQHINILSLNMTATADAAQFKPHGQVALRGTQHFWSDLCKRPQWSSVGSHLHYVVFVCTQVTWDTPTRKSLEASSPGNSRAMQGALHGRNSDFCYVLPKNSHTVRAPCGGTLHGHPFRSCSNKRLRDMYINFLYTTVYFSNISNSMYIVSVMLGI